MTKGKTITVKTRYQGMQHTLDNIIKNQRLLRKKEVRGHRKKSQPWLQSERQSAPINDMTLSMSSTFERSKIIVVPSNKDILCGRGKSFFNHEGNRRFRDIVAKYINPYIEASQRTKRSHIVKAVVHETLETGARFLKKAENKQEWYDGGGKFATEKVGHALRDATSDRSQQLSKKAFFLHEQKKQQNTLGGEEDAPKCDGTVTETLGLETFSTLAYDSLLDCMKAKEKPMQTRSWQSPCLEVSQMSAIKYDEEIPILVENLIFSEASFNKDAFTVFSEKHIYGSVECNDSIDTARLDMHGKAKIRFPSLVSLDNYEKPIDIFFRSNSISQTYLDDVPKPNLIYDEPELTVAVTSTFSGKCCPTDFNDFVLISYNHEDVKKNSDCTSSTSEKLKNKITPFRPQESFVEAGRDRTRNHFASCSKNSRYSQEPLMVNFMNNEYSPTMMTASSIALESCAHSIFNKADSQNYLEHPNLATAQNHKELNVPIHAEDAILYCNELLQIPSDSEKNVSNNLREFQKSDFSNTNSRNMMGLASSIISERCHNAMLNEFGYTNHNRTQSCGSLDSCHIDVFNNINLEELDSSSLGCQDTLD